MRAPVFAGVTAGVGTTTLSVALHGVDGGRYDGRPVDVLVCHADTASLAHAAATPRAPVLAVVATRPVPGGRPRPDPLQGWLDRLRTRFGTVVVLPYVARWRAPARPGSEVAGLLAAPAERRSPYAVALLRITEALLRDGTLTRPAIEVRPVPLRSSPAPAYPRVISRPDPPVVVPLGPGGRSRPLWRGLEPVERRPTPEVDPVTDLDDDALEAEPVRTGA